MFVRFLLVTVHVLIGPTSRRAAEALFIQGPQSAVGLLLLDGSRFLQSRSNCSASNASWNKLSALSSFSVFHLFSAFLVWIVLIVAIVRQPEPRTIAATIKNATIAFPFHDREW